MPIGKRVAEVKDSGKVSGMNEGVFLSAFKSS
jgi:hypothetical protein